MALEIKTVKGEAAKAEPKARIAGERMYFTADGTALVGEGHPGAAILAVAEGRRLHPDMVKRFKIIGGKLAASGENKALKGVSDKGA